MKHLKTFESFSFKNDELVEESLADIVKSIKRAFSLTPEVKEKDKESLENALDKIDTSIVKLMGIDGEKPTQKYTKASFLKLASDLDGCKGWKKIEGDTIYYKPRSFSSASGGLKGTGGAGG